MRAMLRDIQRRRRFQQEMLPWLPATLLLDLHLERPESKPRRRGRASLVLTKAANRKRAAVYLRSRG